MTLNTMLMSETPWNPLSVLDKDVASPVTAEEDTAQSYVIFELKGQWLATNVSQVREILDDQALTSLPNAPGDVEGMIDVRGTSITIVDIAQHLGIRDYSDIQPERIVVFEFDRRDEAPLAIGVRTDTVRDVCHILDASIEDPPEALSSWDQSMIRGVSRVDNRMIIIIDFSTIVSKCSDNSDIFDFT